MWNQIKPCPIILHAQYFSILSKIQHTRWKLNFKDVKETSAVKPLLSSVWVMCQSSPPPHVSGTGQSGRIWSPSFSLSIRLESPDQSPICTDQINAPKEKRKNESLFKVGSNLFKVFWYFQRKKKGFKILLISPQQNKRSLLCCSKAVWFIFLRGRWVNKYQTKQKRLHKSTIKYFILCFIPKHLKAYD